MYVLNFKFKIYLRYGCYQGAYTGVCSQQHIPSYKNNIEKFKAKGIDSVICVAVNDPYALNGWAEKLQAKETVSFFLLFFILLIFSSMMQLHFGKTKIIFIRSDE